ncbi:MAG: DNA polymerase III subunit delta' [Propionibacteriaceae bacterium]
MDQGVWGELVGQSSAVATLRRAVAGESHAMTHAWLLCGPPGSGRSNAARAFAAALQCHDGGCGECQDCRTSLSGAHPDVTLIRTEKISIGVDEIRELVRRAAMSPTKGRQQVLVIEDADRITERGADALLKAIEEPAPKTVWLLCAPTPDDVIVTIRSRCRALRLATPQAADVAQLLVERDGISPEAAGHAARAAQGHIGRARRLATDDAARTRRWEILQLPKKITDVSSCLHAAAGVVELAKSETEEQAAKIEATENAEFERALGFGTKGARPKQAAAAKKDLEEQQKARRTRLHRDAIDRVLTELTGYYRDILLLQTSVQERDKLADLVINSEVLTQLCEQASRTTAEMTVKAMDAILACRTALETNVPPLLAVEALMMELAQQQGYRRK